MICHNDISAHYTHVCMYTRMHAHGKCNNHIQMWTNDNAWVDVLITLIYSVTLHCKNSSGFKPWISDLCHDEAFKPSQKSLACRTHNIVSFQSNPCFVPANIYIGPYQKIKFHTHTEDMNMMYSNCIPWNLVLTLWILYHNMYFGYAC